MRMRNIVLLLAGAWSGALSCPAPWIDSRTPRIPRTVSGKAALSSPAPKAEGGQPDLSGVWTTDPEYFFDLAKELKPDDLPMLPWAQALQKEREANDHGS